MIPVFISAVPIPVPGNYSITFYYSPVRWLLLYILPLVIPILIVIGVNEYTKGPKEGKPYRLLGVEALNTGKAQLKQCSWQCYNNTAYCKAHHVSLLKPYFSYCDPIYFGMIHLLKSSGNYAGANIVFLVILWPLLMYWLFIKVIKSQMKMNQLKKGRR